MAVKAEILSQKAKDGTYDAAKLANTKSLADNIVAKDLTGNSWTVDGETAGIIQITYTDPKIAQGLIDETIPKPRYNGKILYKINLTKQNATLKTDVTEEELSIVETGDDGEGDGTTVKELAQAGQIKIWDRVNYNPGNATITNNELPAGATIGGTKLASTNLPAGATLSGTISASSATDWVVLDVNETTGDVLIMPETVSSTGLCLRGKDGYNNALTAIQKVANIYLNVNQGASVRSLTVEDINKVENHIPDGDEREYTWNYRYGMDT